MKHDTQDKTLPVIYSEFFFPYGIKVPLTKQSPTSIDTSFCTIRKHWQCHFRFWAQWHFHVLGTNVEQCHIYKTSSPQFMWIINQVKLMTQKLNYAPSILHQTTRENVSSIKDIYYNQDTFKSLSKSSTQTVNTTTCVDSSTNPPLTD